MSISLPKNYIFDIDGTLTDIRKPIQKNHKKIFLKWAKSNRYYIATGSDYKKAQEQLGDDILKNAVAVFTCHGAVGHCDGVPWYTKEWRLPNEAFDVLFMHLIDSQFPHKRGLHLEDRKAMYNFSIPGRKCDNYVREKYIEWDKQTNERAKIVESLNKVPGVNAVIGGQLGVDIMPIGLNKKVLARDGLIMRPCTLFCNEFFPGGNDYELGLLVEKVINVESFKNTYEYLQGES